MASRSTQSTVTFRHPFSLSALDGPQPAGDYRLVVDEEEITNISFLAYRRSATMLHTPAIGATGAGQVFVVNFDELERALGADRGA